MPPALMLDDEHTRRTGRKLGDGLYTHSYIARVHKATRMVLDSNDPVIWKVNGKVFSETPSTEIEVTLTAIGDHTITAGNFEYQVSSRSVRSEIRDLSEDDRE